MGKRQPELEVFSGIAILLVVIHHAFGHYLVKGLGIDTHNLYSMTSTQLLFSTFVKLNVPMFIFIAGYKYQLNNNREGYGSFLTKKIKKVFMPFLTYSYIFILAYFCYRLLKIQNLTQIQQAIYLAIKSFSLIFIGQNMAYQLWYIPMYLVVVVLLYPLINRMVRIEWIQTLLYFVASSLIGYGIIFKGIGFPLSFLFYLFPYHLGNLVCKYKHRINSLQVYISSVTYLVLFVLTGIIKQYDINLTIAYLSVPFGLIPMLYVSKMLKDNSILKSLGKYSFYIFLFHEPIILQYSAIALQRVGLLKSPLSVVVLTISTIGLSILVYRVMVRLRNMTFVNRQRLKSAVSS